MQRRIVIADDHPVFLIGLRAVITSTFSDSFIVSDEATNVEQLLASLAQEQPDILLTDFNMPGQQQSDGLRLIETLRRKYPSLPIIVVTVLSNPGIINIILSTGVYAVINKQSLSTELTLCLKCWLNGRRYMTPVPAVAPAEISPRELDVVRLLAQGKSVNDIAALLSRTKQTISAQKKSAMNKLGVSSMTELLEYVHKVGM